MFASGKLVNVDRLISHAVGSDVRILSLYDSFATLSGVTRLWHTNSSMLVPAAVILEFGSFAIEKVLNDDYIPGSNRLLPSDTNTEPTIASMENVCVNIVLLFVGSIHLARSRVPGQCTNPRLLPHRSPSRLWRALRSRHRFLRRSALRPECSSMDAFREGKQCVICQHQEKRPSES